MHDSETMLVRRRTPAWLPLLLALSAGLCHCKRVETEHGRDLEVARQQLQPALPPAADGKLRGKVTLDGSNTVAAVSRVMAAQFREGSPGVDVSVDVSGTGGGFKKLCAGEVDIADASRPINLRESQECRSRGVEYIELPVAFDALTVVVSANNSFVDCLSVGELDSMWKPAAEGHVRTWNQVRSSFPAQPLSLFGKDVESGTYDYFTLAIVGIEGSSRKDYAKSEDDAVTERGVAADPNALGYMGFAYYLANRAQLKPVAIDSGRGCVSPSAETVIDGTYQPLARPLFIYVSKVAAARDEVRAFTQFYLDPENAQHVSTVGFVPLPALSAQAAASRFRRGVMGSVLGGHGAVIGVRLDAFGDEEHLQNELVQ